MPDETPIIRQDISAFLQGGRKTQSYRPHLLSGDRYRRMLDGRPWFTLREAEAMRRDPQVGFGLRILRAALYQVKVSVVSDSNRIGQYVQEQFKSIWRNSLRKMLAFFEYGISCGEVSYKTERRQVVFDRYDPVHPRDARPLEFAQGPNAGKFCGIRVRGHSALDFTHGEFDLLAPHAFWFSGESEYGSYWSYPRIAGSYEPWLEKTGRHGARQSRQLWFKKGAFSGGSMRYPIGQTSYPDGNGGTTVINNQDLARQIAEDVMNGAVMALPSTKDSKGEYEWTYEPPKPGNEVRNILDYPQELDKEILIGMGIPPELVSASTVGSGYSGRAIPAQMFFASCDEVVHLLVESIDRQIIRNLVTLNFGSGIFYQIIPDSLAEKVDEDDNKAKAGKQDRTGASGGMGGGDNGGQPAIPTGGPKPALPNENNKRVQLSVAAQKRLAKKIKRLEKSLKLSFNPNEPRDNNGQWTTGSGSSRAKKGPPPLPSQRGQAGRPTPPANQRELLANVAKKARNRELYSPMAGGQTADIVSQKIPKEFGDQFDAHGVDDIGQLAGLLNGGIDKSRKFYSAPLSSAGQKGYGVSLKDESGFIVLGHPGQTLVDGGIGGVAVADQYEESLPELSKAFPGTKFVLARDLGKILPKITTAKHPPVRYGGGQARLSFNADQPRDESGKWISDKPETVSPDFTETRKLAEALRKAGSIPPSLMQMRIDSLAKLSPEVLAATVKAAGVELTGIEGDDDQDNVEAILHAVHDALCGKPALKLPTNDAENTESNGGDDALMLSNNTDGPGRWVTIGAKEGPDGEKHGGSPVFIKNGVIEKGHGSLKGKTIESLKKTHPKTHKEITEHLKKEGEAAEPEGATGDDSFDFGANVEEPEEKGKGKPEESFEIDGKEPWQMTSREWETAWDKGRPDGTGGGAGRESTRKIGGGAVNALIARHRKLQMNLPDIHDPDEILAPRGAKHRDVIEHAIKTGKPVPPEVLADYPDLAERYGAKPAEPEPAATAPEANSGRKAERGPDTAKSKNSGNSASTTVDKKAESGDTTPVETKPTQGKQMTETAKEMPKLTGSEKQVAWANEIRSQFLSSELGKKLAPAAESMTNASFWISSRGEGQPLENFLMAKQFGLKLDRTEHGLYCPAFEPLERRLATNASHIERGRPERVVKEFKKDSDFVRACGSVEKAQEVASAFGLTVEGAN